MWYIKTIVREWLIYPWQRIKRGYSDRDLWDLGGFYLEVMSDSLKAFEEKVDGYPATEESLEAWRQKLMQMREGIELKRQWSEDFLQLMDKPFQELYQAYYEDRRFMENSFWNQQRSEAVEAKRNEVNKKFKKSIELMVEHWDALWS